MAQNAGQRRLLGAYRPWWLALYQRGFTPAEFRAEYTGSVAVGPWQRGRELPIEVSFEVPLGENLLAASAANVAPANDAPEPLAVAPVPSARSASAGFAFRGQQLVLIPDELDRGIGHELDRARHAYCGRSSSLAMSTSEGAAGRDSSRV